MIVCVYSLYVVLCVGSDLATGSFSVQGVLSTVYRIKKLKKQPRSKGLLSHRERKCVIAHLCRQVSYLFSFPEHCTCACWKIRDNKHILSVQRFYGNWVNKILSPSAGRLYNKHKN
jgi:hypothetical protein